MNITKLQIHHLDVVRFGEGDYFLNSHGDDFLIYGYSGIYGGGFLI